jgi:hypothetical protein
MTARTATARSTSCSELAQLLDRSNVLVAYQGEAHDLNQRTELSVTLQPGKCRSYPLCEPAERLASRCRVPLEINHRDGSTARS